MPNNNNNKSPAPTQGFSQAFNQWFFKVGLWVLGIAIKSVILAGVLNLILMPYSFSVHISEAFLALIAIALIGTCIRDSTSGLRTLTMSTMLETLNNFGYNQMIQNQQIISLLSLTLEKLSGDDQKDDEKQILMEEDTRKDDE